MENRPCLPEIRSCYAGLTPAEKRIADCILEQPAETVGLSAAALAARASTASSAVIRLCRTLGFSGFSEFKMQLAVELAQNETLHYMPGIRPGDSSSEVLEKVFPRTSNVCGTLQKNWIGQPLRQWWRGSAAPAPCISTGLAAPPGLPVICSTG